MPITIGSNIASLGVQRQLSRASDQVSSVFERLASGQRINRASDDAAGLAISDSLGAKARIFSQGVRNINDAISLTNIAEGALSSLSDIVIRQKELAEQSANGSYSAKQRSSLNSEAAALTKEYNRIIQSVSFNGLKVLDGTADAVRIQHGEGVEESTYLALGEAIGVKAGDGTLNAAVNYSVSGNAPYGMTAGDVNGDGIIDLVSANTNSHTISVLIGNGNGTFYAAVTMASGGNGPLSVQIGDYNGDGISDISSANSAGNSVSILTGRGNGTFNTAVTYTVGSTSLGSLTTGDFNSDGVQDLLVTDDGGSSIKILIGNGNGTFKAALSVASGDGPTVARVGDFNGDGVLDIASGDTSANTVSIIIGKGDGTFNSPIAYNGTSDGIVDLRVADFNGDGLLDVVNADAVGTTVSVFLGNGNGTLRAPRTYSTGGFTEGVNIGDFNSDGNIDLVTTIGASVGILIGNGDGTFKARTSYSIAGGSNSEVVVADFNGDGVMDVANSNAITNNINILTGRQDSTGRRNNLQTAYDLTSILGSREALTATTTLLENISKELGVIGANQSRLRISLNNLKVRSENYLAARSRILDSDTAEEAATLVRSQITQKAAAATLAQANQAPALALQLLR